MGKAWQRDLFSHPSSSSVVSSISPHLADPTASQGRRG